MTSSDWVGIGVILIATAIALSIIVFVDYHDLEYRKQETINDYFNGEMDRETYNKTMEDIRDREYFLKVTNLCSSISLYSGLLIAVVGAYKKGDENSRELRNFYKHFKAGKQL